jgi:RNA polymerase sigma factor (sigma-70 family)
VAPTIPKRLAELEDELYSQWRDASDEEKPKLKQQLFNEVMRHARNVIWGKIPETDQNLARDIASVVIEQLGEFRAASKFSTWAHRIILNRCNLYLRQKVVDRNRFYVSEEPEEDIILKDPKAEAAFEAVDLGIDFETVERFVKTLPKKDHVLFECVRDRMTMAEAAERLGDSEDATESRWRRLKARLMKKVRGKGDGK